MNAYAVTLWIHSWMRWAILGLALAVVVRSAIGWARSRAWLELDERLNRLFVAFIDMQFMLGLLLYVFLSPFSALFFAQPGAAMKDSMLRFFGVEHIFAMVIAISLVHVGRVRSKKASTPQLRQRRVCLSTLFALLLIGASIPWPFMPYARPLLRTFSSAHPTALPAAHSRS